MPGIGHLAVGLAAARVTAPPAGVARWQWALALVAASFAPDVDVVAFSLGIPYGAPLGHRGATHSLAFAALSGCVLALAARSIGLPGRTIVLWATVVMASHGVLDAFTDGGRGVALLWPFSDERYFAPWRPIPVSPLGRGVLSSRGLQVMLHESVLFLPLFAIAAWPGRARRSAS